MYLAHYGLIKKPFNISPDPDFLWLGEKHAEALAGLEYGILENKGFLLLTGEVGTGKTVLINGLIKLMDQEVIVANIQDPRLDLVDFYNMLAYKFKMNRRFEKKVDFLIHFEEFLINAYRQNKKALIIIDEAQRLNSELLDEIRVLSNIELDNRKLINIFFVGQSELKKLLLEEKNKSLEQRITYNYHLGPLIESETASFIKHRLKVAGASRSFLTEKAIREIHSFSQGIPRLINIICDHSLMTGYSAGSTVIDVNIIKECSKELQISLDRPIPPSKQAKVIEFDSSYRQPQAIKLKQKPESSNKAASLKIAGIVITIVLLLGIGASFFYMSRIEQSLNSLKQNNEILMSEDSGKNSEKLHLEIANFEEITEDTSTDEFIAENDQGDDKIAEIIVAENQPNKEINDYDTIPKSKVKNLAVGHTQELPLEIAEFQGTTEDTSIDKLAKEKDQSDQTIPVINIYKEQPEDKIEEYDTVRKSETKNLAVEDTQKKPLKNADFDVTEEKITTNNISVETVQSDEKIAEINVAKERPDNEPEKSKANVLLNNQIAEVYVPKKEVSDRKDFLVNDEKQTIAKEVDQIVKPSNSRQSLMFSEHKFIIYFRYNSADLDNKAFEKLKEIAEILSKNSKSEITIEGYADSDGDFNYNKTLSQFRSNIVESYLISQGVAKSNIKAIGLGSQNPIGSNRTRKGRSKNRRVEIKVKIGKNGNSVD